MLTRARSVAVLVLLFALTASAQDRRILPPLSSDEEPRREIGGPRREVEPYDYPAARPTPTDKDADGILDENENRLLEKFAPIFRFDSREDTFPVLIDDFLKQSVLMFRHRNCRDHIVLGAGAVTARSLLRQVHGVGCEHNQGSAASNGPGKRVLPFGSEFFYLDFVACPGYRAECERRAREECRGDGACVETYVQRCLANGIHWPDRLTRPCPDFGITRGFRDVSRIRAYASVRPSQRLAGGTEVFVQLFFPASTQTSAGYGYHEGDWTGVGIHVTREEQIHTVVYFKHDGNQVRYVSPPRPWYGKPEIDGTHVVAYIAAQSHATYGSGGESGRGAAKPTDYHRGNDFVFPTQRRLLNVGSMKHPFPGFEWLEFKGYWGEDFNPDDFFNLFDLEGASPKTPEF